MISKLLQQIGFKKVIRHNDGSCDAKCVTDFNAELTNLRLEEIKYAPFASKFLVDEVKKEIVISIPTTFTLKWESFKKFGEKNVTADTTICAIRDAGTDDVSDTD